MRETTNQSSQTPPSGAVRQQASPMSQRAASFDTNRAEQTPRYSTAQIQSFVDQVLNDGFCILRHHFSREKLQIWRETFDLLLKERFEQGTASGRGANRYYISLPFIMPFADPEIYEDSTILAIIEQLAGDDIVMPELATDTPLKDSEYQVIHRDFALHSPYRPDADPKQPFQFAVNFPLVNITRDNGPFEIVRGTHLMTDEESRERIRHGEIDLQLEPLLMEVGDVMIRDVRALHRGTPNYTDTPRTMVVVGYNCSWHERPQLKIYIPREQYEQLSERGKHLLRLNPVVESLVDAEQQETYSNLYFLEGS
jgi:hypothetical protein